MFEEERRPDESIPYSAESLAALDDGMLCPRHDYSNVVRVYAPENLNREQRLIWYDLLKLFTDAGVITVVDLPALTLAAVGYEQIINTDDDEKPVKSSQIRVVFSFFAKFGCVPAMRGVKSGREKASGNARQQVLSIEQALEDMEIG